MNIYILNPVPSLGEMGLSTTSNTVTCTECNKKDITYKLIYYRFDQWNGEDLINLRGSLYFVSERLKNELLKLNLHNINFKKIVSEKSDSFKFGKKAYQKKIPNFYFLEINHTLDGPEIWWKKVRECPVCHSYQWDITFKGISSSINSSPNADYSPRQVYKESWSGENIFKLKDPGTPIVTQRFLDVINSIYDIKYSFRIAEWA